MKKKNYQTIIKKIENLRNINNYDKKISSEVNSITKLK